MCQTPSKRRTDRRQESNLVHFILKMWHLVAIILWNFLIVNWPNFVYLLVYPGFYPLKFLWSIAVRSTMTDTTEKETNERTDRRTSASVSPSLRWSLTHRPAPSHRQATTGLARRSVRRSAPKQNFNFLAEATMSSGAGTNFKVAGSAHVRRRIFFVVPVHFFGSSNKNSCLGSTVWSVSCLVFFYSRCPPPVPNHTSVPRILQWRGFRWRGPSQG